LLPHHPVAEELTQPQREALHLAYDRGYFETPRQTTLAELARELDITGQSLGARLNRGINTVLAQTLVDPDHQSH
jgi:predicted DNA binding protein